MHSITDGSDTIHTYQRGDLHILTREDVIQYAGTLLELFYQRDKLSIAAFCRLLPAFFPGFAQVLPAFFLYSPATLASMKKIFQRHCSAFSDPFQQSFRRRSDAVQTHYATVLIGKGDRA